MLVFGRLDELAKWWAGPAPALTTTTPQELSSWLPQSYRERMAAARAAASAQRKAEQAARQRQIELRCEVHRLALAAVKAGIQAKGQRKLSTYSRAELTMMARGKIAPWFIEQMRGQDRCADWSHLYLNLRPLLRNRARFLNDHSPSPRCRRQLLCDQCAELTQSTEFASI